MDPEVQAEYDARSRAEVIALIRRQAKRNTELSDEVDRISIELDAVRAEVAELTAEVKRLRKMEGRARAVGDTDPGAHFILHGTWPGDDAPAADTASGGEA